MTESKHTPGPWKVVHPRDGSGFTKIIGPNGEIIDIFGSGYFNNKNIDLIADAWQLPDLRREIAELKAINKEMLEVLKACEELQGDVLMEVSTSQRIFNAMVEYNEKLNKVIRKARGEGE